MESGDKPLPQCEDVAAVFQDALVKHLLQKTHRALLYCQQSWPQVKHLVSQKLFICQSKFCLRSLKLSSKTMLLKSH